MTEKPNPQEVEFAFSPEDFTNGEDDGIDVELDGTVEAKPSLDKIKVKYNKEEKELSYDEAVEYAQKGMNYDHILSERDNLKKSRAELEELAKEDGKTLDEFIASIKESKYNSKIENRMKELVSEGVPESHARKMAELELSKPVTKDPLVEEFKALHAEFPETKDLDDLSKFPQEVIESIKGGKSPVIAWAKYSTEQAKKQAEIDKNNSINSIKDTGSLSSKDDVGKKDKFLEGLGL